MSIDKTNNNAVTVRGLVKSYGKRLAVNGVDLDIKRGEIYGLIGPDGAGKSTIMKIIAGVLTFDSGNVQVFDNIVNSEASAERIKHRIGFMPQGLGLNMYPDLSVEENIDFFARLRLVPENLLKERKKRLLAMTRLESFRDRAMKNLSGGMKQKLGLVCTLIHQPDLVILDEPTTGVDPVSRRDFWAILALLLRENGITALVSTAYMDEASRFQRAALIYKNKVLIEGEPDEIAAMAKGIMVIVDCEQQTEALHRLRKTFPQIEAMGRRIRVWVNQDSAKLAKEAISNALDGMTINKIETSEPELEDVFVAKLQQQNSIKVDLPKLTGKATSGEAIAIDANQLSKTFGLFRAVDNISFTVPRGEIFGLLGANGAGKTTAIKMLTGILKPTTGEGRVAGADMRGAGRLIKQRVGYMSQAFSLYLDLTIIENIRLFAGIYGLNTATRRERTKWILDLTGLVGMEGERAGNLPMGLRQRLALGCALVHRPQILFLDEPTSGVDPLGRRRFWDILFYLAREEKVTILVTTHYMSEAEHCDHLALMYAGRVVADDTPDAMKQAVTAQAGELMAVSTDQPLNALGILQKAGVADAALFGKRIHILSPTPTQTEQHIRQLLSKSNITITSVQKRALSMEDVFVYRVLELEHEEARIAS